VQGFGGHGSISHPHFWFEPSVHTGAALPPPRHTGTGGGAPQSASVQTVGVQVGMTQPHAPSDSWTQLGAPQPVGTGGSAPHSTGAHGGRVEPLLELVPVLELAPMFGSLPMTTGSGAQPLPLAPIKSGAASMRVAMNLEPRERTMFMICSREKRRGQVVRPAARAARPERLASGADAVAASEMEWREQRGSVAESNTQGSGPSRRRSGERPPEARCAGWRSAPGAAR